MKRIILSLAVFLFAAAAWGQQPIVPGVLLGNPTPGGACLAGPGQIITATGLIYTCQSNVWVVLSSAANPVTAGLIAEYRFMPTESGTNSTDYVGSNTCVWSATAPSRDAGTGGLQLGYSTHPNNCNTGIASTSAVTIVAYIQFTVPTASTTYNAVMQDSTASSNMLLTSGSNNATGLLQNFNHGGGTKYGLPGYGEVGWIRSNSSDVYVINGQVGGGTANASLPGTGGTWLIGAGSGNAAIYPASVTVQWVDIYNTALTAAQVTAVQQWQSQQVAFVKGVINTPQNSGTGAILDCHGDSITYGTGATPYCSHLSLNTAATIYNSGNPGDTLANIAYEYPRVAALFPPVGLQANLIEWGGTNDISGQSGSGTVVAATAAYLAGVTRQAKTTGWSVFLGTMLARSATDDVHRDAFNNLIRQNWKAWGAAGLMDWAANPALGADGGSSISATSCSGGAWFQSDHIHPTSCAQGGWIATLASNVLNYTYGANDSNPSTTVSNAYSVLYTDAVLVATPTAGATYTLPDCEGMTGYTWKITNTSAFTITMASTNDVLGNTEPISGLATVPANTTVTYVCTLNAASTGGAHWIGR